MPIIPQELCASVLALRPQGRLAPGGTANPGATVRTASDRQAHCIGPSRTASGGRMPGRTFRCGDAAPLIRRPTGHWRVASDAGLGVRPEHPGARE